MASRKTVVASSLGSYFGVGFLSPQEQLMVDLGVTEQDFDEAAEDRMLLGKVLEDATLDYFEKKKSIKINNRNRDVIEGFDGMLRMKIDGETIYEGEPTIVECKISNSESKVFTKDLGYKMQCNAYMATMGYSQALLLGLYKGKPIETLLKADDELIEDIGEMVLKVYGILNGILPEEDFPWHLVEKYSNSPKLETLSELETDDMLFAKEYAEIQETIKPMEKRLEEIKEYFKAKYDNVKYKDDNLSFTVTSSTRKGFLDEIELEIAYPDIDLDKFRKSASLSKRITINKR